MHTKLTLRLEKSLIEKAKEWADQHQISLSQVVAMLFKKITLQTKHHRELHPFTKKLLGAALRKGTTVTDEEMNDIYRSYLEEKYK